jgi:hypothetical protein
MGAGTIAESGAEDGKDMGQMFLQQLNPRTVGL